VRLSQDNVCAQDSQKIKKKDDAIMISANQVQKFAVIGAGVMGHSIAQVAATAGIETHLVDLDMQRLTHAHDLIRAELKTLAECEQISHAEIAQILDRIHMTTDITAAGDDADFVLEAVSEIPEVKKHVFSQLEKTCPPEAVLASNTSTLDIFNLVDIQNPLRFVVAHWFAPPNIIPLVEVAPGPQTAPEVVDFTVNLMRRLGKKPVVMKQFIPSLIVNRIQAAISAVVFEILQNDWATPEQIDTAVKTSLGIRLPVVGVVQSMDFTGLDLIVDITKSHGGTNPFIEKKVEGGFLGAKTSKGIYDYGGRSENDIIHKRDTRYLRNLENLVGIRAFEPI
jgi:3-hydroxyacyl-CoA dehydrogenase